MNVAIRLTLLGAMLMMTACQKKDVPPPDGPPKDPPGQQTACDGCDWQNFVDKPIKIVWIECTSDDGKPVPCNWTTTQGEPNRELTVTFDPATGSYSWQLVSPGKEGDRMNCTNLAKNPNNPRIIEGTCLIGNGDGTFTVHFFRSSLAPREDNAKVAGVFFRFQHKPFALASDDPVHNGEGHD